MENLNRNYNSAMAKGYKFLDALFVGNKASFSLFSAFMKYLDDHEEVCMALGGHICFLGGVIHNYCENKGASLDVLHSRFKNIYYEIDTYFGEMNNERSTEIEYLLKVLKAQKSFGSISSN